MRGTLVAAWVAVAVGAGQAQAQAPVLEPGRDSVQPGMLVAVGESRCTGGFIYDGVGELAGRHYLGLAAHCTEDAIGAPVADGGGRVFGTVAFSLWPYDSYADDYAFVEIDRASYPRVDPALAGHPGIPTGVLPPGGGAPGDRVQLSGWGFATRSTTATREQRVSFLNSHNDRLWFAAAIVSNVDSGGPAVHVPTGGALGSVSSVCLPLPIEDMEGFEPGCTVWGPSIAGILAGAAARGFTAEVRTADEGPPPIPPPPVQPAPAGGSPPPSASEKNKREAKPKKRKACRKAKTRSKRSKRCRKR